MTVPAQSRERWALAALLIAFALLATAFSVIVPIFEAPDEHLHYGYVRHLSHTRSLPVQTDDPGWRGGWREAWEQEGSQPPLYYFVALPLSLLFDRVPGAALGPTYNHQNTMGYPEIVGNENRFIHHLSASSVDPAERGRALAVLSTRLLSTLMGALTVFLVWWIARRVLPDRPWLALASAGIVAFNPQFVYSSASITNDSLIVLLATASLALLLRIADGHDGWATVIALALVAGLAPLTKLSGLAVTGFALLTLIGLAWRRRDVTFLLRTGGLVVLAALVLSGWWYLRNMQLYGDVTGISAMLPGDMRRDFELGDWLAGLPGELRGVWYSSWGLFGWFTIMLPKPVYGLITVAALSGLVGLATAAWRRATWIDWPRLAWLGLWAVVVLVSLLRWMTIAKGGHGRLLFPAIAFVGIALTAGWRVVVPRRFADTAFAGGVVAVFLALSLFSLFGVIRPAFAGPETITLEDVPESAIPADVVFDEGVRLVAAEVPHRVTEGNDFAVTLYWQVLDKVERDGFVALRVDQRRVAEVERTTGADVEEIVPGDVYLAYPGAGTTPFYALQPEDVTSSSSDSQESAGPSPVYVDRHVITAPEVASPELILARSERMPLTGRLSVHVYDQEAIESWPAASSIGDPVPDWSTEIVIDPQHTLTRNLGRNPPEWFTGMHAISDVLRPDHMAARFDNGLEVYRADWWSFSGPVSEWGSYALDDPHVVENRDLSQGESAIWLVNDPVDEDLTLFVHLVDADGNQVATFDRPPATHGPYATSDWRSGEVLLTTLPWMIPDGTPLGEYLLRVGLYDPEDGTRVPAFRPDGTRWPDDAVLLRAVIVEGE